MRLIISSALAVCVAVAGCSTSSTDPGVAGDGGGDSSLFPAEDARPDAPGGEGQDARAPDDGSDDAAPIDASADGSAEGSEETGADAGPCSTLLDISAPITPVHQSGSPPIMTGGAFQPGTYVLTSVDYWGSTISGPLHGTFRFTGTGSVSPYEYADDTRVEQGTASKSSNGANMGPFYRTCPLPTADSIRTMTITGTEYVELFNGVNTTVRHYTKVTASDAGDGG